MWKYFEPIAELIWFFVILAVDVVVYYSYGGHPSIIPDVLCLVATLVVGVIVGMAEYEIYKHRNDKEAW
jgi:hypothetical protein